MSAYRFPPMARVDGIDAYEQLGKVKDELREAKAAYYAHKYGEPDGGKREAYGMELLDVIHATETALRMEFDDDEVERLRAGVIYKNARRGYYEAVD